jgi:MFS family permease
VADVTSREERSRAMGVVGAAFGLGLVTGPVLGALSSHVNLAEHFPVLEHLGFNPFSMPALISLALCVVNIFWIRARFAETLPESARATAPEPRVRNPLSAILGLENPAVRRANIVVFIYSVAFVAMEATLTFLAAERFGYTARQNGWLLGFLGLCAVVMQGYIVRRLLKQAQEVRLLSIGLVLTALGLVGIGFAGSPGWLYAGLACLAAGSGLVNPVATGLISLYADASSQGRVLGIYRSLGSLARAITPVAAGILYWAFHANTTYVVAATLALAASAMACTLPQPRK